MIYKKNFTQIISRNYEDELQCYGILNVDIKIPNGTSYHIRMMDNNVNVNQIADDQSSFTKTTLIELFGVYDYAKEQQFKTIEVGRYTKDYMERYKQIVYLENRGYIKYIPEDTDIPSNYDQLYCIFKEILNDDEKKTFNMKSFEEYCKNNKEFYYMINYLTERHRLPWK